MHYLLDTHALIWFFDKPEALKPWFWDIYNAQPEVFLVSCVSLWELAIKENLNKLEIKTSFEEFLQNVEATFTDDLLPIKSIHLHALRVLPTHHKEPFDRLLIAQAMAEQMTLVSKDSKVGYYNVKHRW